MASATKQNEDHANAVLCPVTKKECYMSLFKSLFGKKTPTQPNTVSQTDPWKQRDYQIQIHLQKQNRMLSELSKAEEKYKEDNDIGALIAVYERLFYMTEDPLRCSSDLRLADLYLKNKENDKAWGYLNYLSLGKLGTPLYKVRDKQARILKSEGRHKESIRFFLMAYLLKCRENSYPQREAFKKDIAVPAKKQGWSEIEVGQLADILDAYVRQRCFDPQKISDTYSDWVERRPK